MKMPVMQAVVDVLESEGVDVVFGIPGAAILPLYDGLEPSPIRHITVRHEAGGCFAADGYARATGRVGVNWAPRAQPAPRSLRLRRTARRRARRDPTGPGLGRGAG